MQGQGKGARPAEKCGVCVHCTRPALRKGCLNPIVRSENPNEAPELQSKCAAPAYTQCAASLGFARHLQACVADVGKGCVVCCEYRYWGTQRAKVCCRHACINSGTCRVACNLVFSSQSDQCCAPLVLVQAADASELCTEGGTRPVGRP